MLRKKSGFTLVELILALALSGLVMVTGIFLVQFFTGMGNKANDSSQAQQLARLQTEFLESELRYAFRAEIGNTVPNKLSEDFACIYINNNKIWRKDPGQAGQMISTAGFDEYDYDIRFMAEGEKILRTDVSVLKKGKQLFKTHFTLYIENLYEGIEGLNSGITLVYEKKFKPVTSIGISSDKSFLSGSGEPMQMWAGISPINASNKGVIWSVKPSTHAEIDDDGLLYPLRNGNVTVTAIALDGSGVSASKEVEIKNLNLVNKITISGRNNTSYVRVNHTLQLSANISPQNAANKKVEWSITYNSKHATIDEDGLLKATSLPSLLLNRVVVVRATATDGSGVYGQYSIALQP